MLNLDRGPRGTDPLLLVEAALALLLFALFVFLFLVPAARPPFDPEWWTWPLVGTVFFGLLGVDALRRKRGRSRERAAARPGSRAGSTRPDEPVPPAV